MISTASLRDRGRIIFGVAGDGNDWTELRNYLKGLRWSIDVFDVGASSQNNIDSVLPLVDDVDLALVLVATSDGAFDREEAVGINRIVGVLQGRLGTGRVLVVNEDAIDSSLAGNDVMQVDFKRNQIADKFVPIAAGLEDLLAASETLTAAGRAKRAARVPTRFQPEVWAAAGVLIVLLALLAAVGLQLLLSSAGSAETSDNDSGSVGETAAAPSTGTETNQDLQLSGVSPSAEALPVDCQVDISQAVLLPAEIPCGSGTGGVRIEGHRGPWHNRTSTVQFDDGVYVELHRHEPNPVVSLVSAGSELSLNSGRPLVGIETIDFRFSANGQRVKLGGPDGRVTLTFSLDL